MDLHILGMMAYYDDVILVAAGQLLALHLAAGDGRERGGAHGPQGGRAFRQGQGDLQGQGRRGQCCHQGMVFCGGLGVCLRGIVRGEVWARMKFFFGMPRGKYQLE